MQLDETGKRYAMDVQLQRREAILELTLPKSLVAHFSLVPIRRVVSLHY